MTSDFSHPNVAVLLEYTKYEEEKPPNAICYAIQ